MTQLLTQGREILKLTNQPDLKINNHTDQLTQSCGDYRYELLLRLNMNYL